MPWHLILLIETRLFVILIDVVLTIVYLRFIEIASHKSNCVSVERKLTLRRCFRTGPPFWIRYFISNLLSALPAT